MVSASWMISEDLYVNVRMVILEDYAKSCSLGKMEKEFAKGMFNIHISIREVA
jgi:hypothetical protein